jgi:hypothetical protein
MRIVLAGVVLMGLSSACQSQEPPLNQEEAAFLQRLIDAGIWDPLVGTGGQRRVAKWVKTEVTMRSCWGRAENVPGEGWLIPATGGQPEMVVTSDFQVVLAPAKVEALDLEKKIAALVNYEKKPMGDSEERFAEMEETARGEAPDRVTLMVWAAWLLRLGREQEASVVFRKALAQFQDEKALPLIEKQLLGEMAWRAFSEAANAYILRADDEALFHAERLSGKFPSLANERGRQGAQLLAELKRRKAEGRFFALVPKPAKPVGQAPASDTGALPDGFDTWPIEKRVARLIQELEEVDARQMGQPGGVDLGGDIRVRQLIDMGDAAVPQLLDCLEKDQRLTRSMHFWRDFSTSRTILSVREAALTALMSILQVTVFEPCATGDNFTSRKADEAKAVTAQLRKYWAENGKLSLPERMMKVLADQTATPEALREASYNLGHMKTRRIIGTTVFVRGETEAAEANPVKDLFKNPTAAEAILAAMDRDLAARDKKPNDYQRRGIEDTYVFALVGLGDKRIAPVLLKRWEETAASASIRMRRKWAFALSRLGEPTPLQTYAREVETGHLKLPANDQPQTNADDQPGAVELREAVRYLLNAGAAGDAALRALAHVDHPWHTVAKDRVLNARLGWDETVLFHHPFCLTILHAELTHLDPTGVTYSVKDDELIYEEKNSRGSRSLPEFLQDAGARVENAPERYCDVAAMRLHELVLGLPAYHPLQSDAAARLAKYHEFFRTFRQLRIMRAEEAQAMRLSSYESKFVPVLPPLRDAATFQDVKEGRALFSLNGPVRPAGVRLPALVTLKKDVGKKEEVYYLALQAEKDAKDHIRYGLLGPEGILVVDEDKVQAVQAIEAKPQETPD